MVWLIFKPASCIPQPCLRLLWVLEGSALLILQLSNSQGFCWRSHCNNRTEWAVLGGDIGQGPFSGQARPPRVRCS